MSKRQSFTAFTITDLIIAVAVIAILAGFVLPTFFRAKKEAAIQRCSVNLKDIYEALILYANQYDDWVTPYSTDGALSIRNENWIAAKPKEWRDSLWVYSNSKEIFFCPLFEENSLGFFNDWAGSQRAKFTSYQMNPFLVAPDIFGSADGAFRLNLTKLPNKWPFPPSETIYILDALIDNDSGPGLISSHGEKAARLYLDGHVRNAPIEQR